MGEVMLDYAELVKNGSDPKSFFKLLRKPIVEHKAKDAQWFGCVLWDDDAGKEFQIHQEMGGTLQTKMFVGRMLRNCIKEPLEGMAEQMEWKQPFLLVDVIGDKLGTCGINKCLRVRETPTWNTGGGPRSDGVHKLRTWDLVIFPECVELAEEMIRPEYSGVKKTVCIWNADVSRYPVPWIDSGVHVSGEIFLKATKKIDEKILTVIIFHHGGLGNFEGVPVQHLKPAGDKVIKLHCERFQHCELMIVKLYPGSMPKGDLVVEETGEKSDLMCSSSRFCDNDTEERNDEEPVSIALLRDVVEHFPVDNLGPLKEKLEKMRDERMETNHDQNKEIRSGSIAPKSCEKDVVYLSTSSTSVDTSSDDEELIAGCCDHGQEAVLVIDETDYENSDAQSETMSIDVMKEANKEIRELAKLLLGCRK